MLWTIRAYWTGIEPEGAPVIPSEAVFQTHWGASRAARELNDGTLFPWEIRPAPYDPIIDGEREVVGVSNWSPAQSLVTCAVTLVFTLVIGWRLPLWADVIVGGLIGYAIAHMARARRQPSVP